MEISGKIIAVLPQATGQGKNGMWRSQDYVLETADQYPKKVCFNLFNDKIDQFPMAIDDVVNVSFDVESREYNGRWYNDVRVWRIAPAGQSASAPAQQQAYQAPQNYSPAPQPNYGAQTQQQAPAPTIDDLPADDPSNDLPF